VRELPGEVQRERRGRDEGLGYVVFEPSPPRFLQLPGAMTRWLSAQRGYRTEDRRCDQKAGHGAFDQAYHLLATNRQVLDRCAQALLAKETLDEAAIVGLTRDLGRSAGATVKEALAR